MHSGLEHEVPGGDAEHDEQHDPCDARGDRRWGPPQRDGPEQQHDGYGDQQRHRVEFAREEERDDQNRDEVVDDGEREQQGTEPARQPLADQRQHAEREGDVGRGRDRPAGHLFGVAHDREEDERRGDDATDRRDRRHERFARAGEFAVLELVPEFDRREKEEDREQPVGDPVPEAQVNAHGGDVEVARLETQQRRADGGVREEEAKHCGSDEQQGAGTFVQQSGHRPILGVKSERASCGLEESRNRMFTLPAAA